MIQLNEYTLSVTLEQYTPLLHFQGTQQGACLRATEVKPKLDRFITGYLEKNGAEVPAQWKLDTPDDKRHIALRYKLRLRPLGPDSFGPGRKPHPLYFAGGMKGKSRPSSGMFFRQGIQMTVLSLVPAQQLPREVPLPGGGTARELLPLIEGLLPSFFALHGFGTRSRKGFGSFGVKGRAVSMDQLAAALPADCLGFFHMKRSDGSADLPFCEDYLDDVYTISAIMKGGVNLPNSHVYLKGALQRLWSERGIGTEKAFLKSKVFTDEDRKGWYRYEICNGNDHTPWGESSGYRGRDRYEFERAILGLTDHYTFGFKKDSKRTFAVNYDKSVRDKQKRIRRFPNPVEFRPFSDGLLIVVHEIPDKMYDQLFHFGADPQKAIRTPARGSFDLWEFVSSVLRPFGDGSFPEEWDDLFNRRAAQKFYGKTSQERVFRYDDTLNNLRLLSERRIR